MSFRVPEDARQHALERRLYGMVGDAGNGVFLFDGPHPGRRLYCIASDGLGWEHVSVSVRGVLGRLGSLPTWREMSHVRALFWEPEDCAMQIHPPESEYVDNAQVLHLWRPVGVAIPRPHFSLVGTLEAAR